MNFRSGIAHSLVLACVALLATACGKNTYDNSPVLATVNGENVTQAQLDFVKTQIAAAHPGASAPENAQVLKELVEQRLVTQKAEKDKLDRNPGVLQALEATRKDALARFYIEQLTTKVPKPTPAEIQQYYDGHPLNFAQRSIFTIQKVDAKVAADQAPALAASVQAATSATQVVDLLKAKAAATNVTLTPQPAESLGPLLQKIAVMKVGQTIVIPQPGGMSALTVVDAQPRPVTLDQARASIEQGLWNQHKREVLQAEAKSLRAAAKVEYLGKFAADAASAPVAGAPASAADIVIAAPEAASAASQ
jgi:EpsD family peptidyl-prolyl cis-trans isomerase